MKDNNLLNWWRNKVLSSPPKFLIFQGILLFLGVFLSALLPSPKLFPLSTNDNPNVTESIVERNKFLVPSIWAVEVSLITLYLTSINTKLVESEKNRVVISVPSGDLEYVSLIHNALNVFPDRVDRISKELNTMISNCGLNSLKEQVSQIRLNSSAQEDFIVGLKKGLAEPEDIEGLTNVIRTAIDSTLGENDKSRELFYKCMYAYVTAWLACSIKYNKKMPIDPIFYQDPSRKDLYIKAIEDLIHRFHYETASKFFTPESVEMILKYLNDLVTIINQQPVVPDEAYIIN